MTLRNSLLVCVLVVMATPAAAQLKATLVASGLTLPVAFVQNPSDPTMQVIVEKGGLIKVRKDGVVQAAPFLDLSAVGLLSNGGEQGLLDIAFAPDYAASGRVYVSFTDINGSSVVARFLRNAANPLTLDAATRFDFLWPGGNRFITHPALCSGAVCGNHNGGHVAFGPDGYLYVGFGDGGSANDPLHLAQNPQSLLGKMLRLNVAVPLSDVEGYDVPPTNPFVGSSVLPEIWAFGLRNPWRWSFDYPRAGSTGAMVIGDVGQGQREEVDYQPMGVAGFNYGWRNREGSLAHIASPPPLYGPLRDPLLDYDRNAGRSITGGFVYRGQMLGPGHLGRYFYADFALSRVWSVGLTIDPASGEATAGTPFDHSVELGGAAGNVSSFGVDAAGELYIVNYIAGAIHRIELNAPPPAGSCTSADPHLAFGGGLCFNGVWLSRSRGTDFSGDERPDLLFANPSKQLYAWFMQGSTRIGGTFLTPGQLASTRSVVGIHDFTGDAEPDLVVQDQSTGGVSIFIMNGTTLVAEQPLPIAAGTPWRVVATGDYDGDSFADLLWWRSSTGQFYIWFMQPSGGGVAFGGPGGSFRGGYLVDGGGAQITQLAPWRVVGGGDINGDGKSDLFRQNDGTGALAVWTLDGTTMTTDLPLSPAVTSPAWLVRAVGDHNGDQHVDFVWEHQTTGHLYVWFMVGRRFAQGAFLSPNQVNPIWQITGPR